MIDFKLSTVRGSLTVAPKKEIKSENSIKSENNKKEKCK